MKKIISKSNQTSEVIYLESLNRLILQERFPALSNNKTIFFVTTQKFYEFYYEKMTRNFSDKMVYHWYICPNNDKINYIQTYRKVLEYIEEMKIPENTTLIAAGNDKIFHLCGQIKENSPFISNINYIPTTLKGLMASLKGYSYLLTDKLTISMKQYSLPDVIVYDTMLNELEDNQTWSDDFFELVKNCLMLDFELLNTIVPLIKQHDAVWSPFIERIIGMFEEDELETDLYLNNLAASFYQLYESHYLSRTEKENISFLLFFLWSIKKNELFFDFSEFVDWLKIISKLQLSLPNQMNTYDLAESIVSEMKRYDKMLNIKELGKVSLSEIPTFEEIYHVVESYRTIIK